MGRGNKRQKDNIDDSIIIKNPTPLNYYQETEKRLRLYPICYARITKFEADIEDLKKEHAISYGLTGKSKDIVKMPMANQGIRLDAESILHGKILSIQKKIQNDKALINDLEWAMQCLINEPYEEVIELFYIQGKTLMDISEWFENNLPKLVSDETALCRQKNRLVKKIMYRLFGADAI